MRKTGNSKRGAALFTVMVIIMVVSGMLAAAVTAGLQRSFSAKRLGDRLRAQAIAEAGANKAYSVLKLDFGQRTNSALSVSEDFAGGRYDVKVTPIGDYVAVIHSTGTYNSVSEDVILDISRFGWGTNPELPDSSAYDAVICVEGEITWTGNSEFYEGGLVHANGQFSISGSGEMDPDLAQSATGIDTTGNACNIFGDAKSPVIKDKKNRITGTKTTTAVPPIEIPEIDLTPYYNYALANGQVYNGLHINHDFEPAGGVAWVNGDLSISGNGLQKGCFVVTGDIKLTGGTHAQYGNLPAFISRDGEIQMAGNGDYHGTIYTRIGDIRITGTGRLFGGILCGGNLFKSGNSSIFSYVNTKPVYPGADSSTGDIVATVWQK